MRGGRMQPRGRGQKGLRAALHPQGNNDSREDRIMYGNHTVITWTIGAGIIAAMLALGITT